MKIRKNTFKYILDAIMLLFLVLMYNKNAISMSFHEIGGLFLIGLCVIHLLFNSKWISAVTKRLFDKQTPGKVRLGYCVDALLFVAFALIGVSGVLISKVLFSLHGGGAWKIIHYFASAVAVVLMGVHLGLHWNMLRMRLLGTNAFAKRGARIAGIAALCLVMAFGVYSMATTSFVRWITMPFSAASFPGGNDDGEGSGQGAGMGHGKNRVEVQTEEGTEQTTADASAPALGDGDVGGAPATGSDDKGNTVSVVGDDGNTASAAVPDGSADSNAPAADGSGEGKGAPPMNGGGNSEGMPARDGGAFDGEAAPGGGEFRGEGHGGQGSVSSTLLLIANYLSITVLFAAITRGIELLISRRGKNLPAVGDEK